MDHRRLFIGDSPQAQRLRHVLLDGGMILDLTVSVRPPRGSKTPRPSAVRPGRLRSGVPAVPLRPFPPPPITPHRLAAGNPATTRPATPAAPRATPAPFFRFSRIAGICRFYFTQARPASRSASSTWAQIRFWASIPSSRRDAMSIVLTFSNGFAPAGRNDRPVSCSGPTARPAEPSAPLGRRTRDGRYPINMASLRDGRARSLPPPQTVKI